MQSTTLKKLGLPLAALALVTGIAGAQSLSTTSTTNTPSTKSMSKGFGRGGERHELTAAEKTEMDAKRVAFEATLTADQKVAMEKAHKLMESGDRTGAEAIIKAASITMPAGMGGHRGGAMNNMTDVQKAELKTKREAFEATLSVDQKAAFTQLMYR